MNKEKILAEFRNQVRAEFPRNIAPREQRFLDDTCEKLDEILTAQDGECPECGGVNEAGDNSPCPV